MRFALASLALALCACDGAAPPPDGGDDSPVLLEVRVARPALDGTPIAVRGLGLDRLGLDARLSIERGGGSLAVLDRVPGSGEEEHVFLLDDLAVAALGPGTHAVDVLAFGNGVASRPFPVTLEIATELPVSLEEAPRGEVHRNDVAVLVGDGILTASEGELTARFVGTFTRDDGGGAGAVDVALRVAPLERVDRSRGVVVLTTDLGGLWPGTFEGTVQLRSRLRSGASSESRAIATSLHFNPPDLYALDPAEATVGQVLRVRGAGFLGGPDRPDEATLIRLEGVFTPADASPESFGPRELVPRYVSGAEVTIVVEPAIRRDQLASELFGHVRGRFVGTATPIAIKGTDELVGASVPFGFVLGPVRQVVFVRFLPGFFSSLTSFGLAQAAAQIALRVQARIQDVYARWNVDIRLDEPDDYVRSAYSLLEIGGPDPNGIGLFGYDNTPGKDIGNLRLFDSIGGTNAQTQSDGYPGYGGVFIESFLYWSERPGLSGERPRGAPDADPLFDEIFDPVRRTPATLAEARGEASGARAEAVARAIDALGSIIGETAAHELGHSFGMAQPYGSPTAYHNDFDGEGCLMDSGGNRPLAERMGLPTASPTTLCYDETDYMDEILPR